MDTKRGACVDLCRLVPLNFGQGLVLRKAPWRQTFPASAGSYGATAPESDESGPAQSMTFSGRIASLDRFRPVSLGLGRLPTGDTADCQSALRRRSVATVLCRP